MALPLDIPCKLESLGPGFRGAEYLESRTALRDLPDGHRPSDCGPKNHHFGLQIDLRDQADSRLVGRIVQRLAQIQSRFQDLGTLFAAAVVLRFGITAAGGIRNGRIQAFVR